MRGDSSRLHRRASAPAPRSTNPKNDQRRVVLGVTSAVSLRLLDGFPEYLARRGWDVHVICAHPPPRRGSPVAYHHVEMVREPSWRKDAVALTAWVRLLQHLSPDLVVVGTPKAGLLGITAARLCGVPCRIYMLRGLRLETEAGVRRALYYTLEWLSARLATRVLAVSDSLRTRFIDMRLARAHDVVVVGHGSSNGVRIPTAAPVREIESDDQPGRIRPPEFVVGYVGRIHRDKGLLTLFAAAREMAERGTRIRILLVGSEEPEGHLQECLEQTKLSPAQVDWVGQDDKPERFYPQMDVLCLPTLREGFPNVILEAAAHSVPAIASRVTGCVDAVVDGVTGYLFRPKDPSDLRDKLVRLVADEDLVRQLGRAARERAEQEFERSAVWHRTEHFFRKECEAGRTDHE